MKPIKTLFFTGILTSAATVAAARGFGFGDHSDNTTQSPRDGTRAPAVSSGQGMSSVRSAPAPTRSYSAPERAAPSVAPASRITPSPAATYTPAGRPASGAFYGGTVRETPTPQVRTYTAPRAVADNSGSPFRTRSEDTPRTTIVREAPARPAADTPYITREVHSSGFAGAASRSDGTTRSGIAPVQTTTPRVVSDDNARNSGTSRGAFQTHPESATPAVPAIRSQSAGGITRVPAEGRAPAVITERPQTTSHTPFTTARPQASGTSASSVAPADAVRSDTRAAGSQSPFAHTSTRDRDTSAIQSPHTPFTTARPQASGTSASSVAPANAVRSDTRAAGSQSPFAHTSTRDSADGSRAVTSHSPFQRITTPDTRLTPPAAPRGTANLRFGSASDNIRSRTGSAPMSYGTSLRPNRHADDLDRGSVSPARSPIPSRLADRRELPGSPDRRFSTTSRYPDGRFSVYHAPERTPFVGRPADFHMRPEPRDFHGDSRHRPSYHFDPYAYRYNRHAFSPVWCGPVVYPAGSYFGFSWSSGSFGLSFASYSPAYAYTSYTPYYYTPYYDSWSCGGRGYTGVYYGGWRHHWYGGFSYVYNPWPVYRTYYFYEPAPVVETVYVTQPATTYVVQNPAPVTVIQQPQAAPPAVAAGFQQAQAAVVTESQQVQAATTAAPAADQAGAAVTSCLCPCHCNGQRPCTCAYPCGSEYAITADQIDLSLEYSSYAETLAPESIWSSYAGLDRADAYSETGLSDVTVSAETNLH